MTAFIPAQAISHVAPLLAHAEVTLHVSRPRQSKLGHFKRYADGSAPEISINGDLEATRFLFTLIHEIAHWYTYVQYGKKVRPHGAEWQAQFRELMQPLLVPEIFPTALLQGLRSHLSRPKASCGADPALQQLFDAHAGIERPTLAGLQIGSRFRLPNGRTFIKGEKKRTRYLCRDVRNRRWYLVPGAAPVVEATDEKPVI